MWEWSWLCAQGASASTSWRFSSVVNETLPQCWGYPTARTFTGSHTPLSIYSRSLNCPAAYANARSGPSSYSFGRKCGRLPTSSTLCSNHSCALLGGKRRRASKPPMIGIHGPTSRRDL